jgi:hypothetical protein
MSPNLKHYAPYILLTPFYLALGSFIYYFFVSLTPAQEVRVVDYRPKTIVAGDELTITYDVVRHRNCENRITRYLYNKRTLTATSIGYIERQVIKGRDPEYNSVVRIPPNTPNGEYDLSAENKPVCNFYDLVFPSTIPIPSVSITVDNSPVVLYSLTVLNKDARLKQGEPVQLENAFDKRRFCSAVVDTFVFRDDNTLVAKFSRPTTSLQLGKTQVKESIPLDISPGKYSITRTVTYTCPERVYNFKYEPPPKFEVTE